MRSAGTKRNDLTKTQAVLVYLAICATYVILGRIVYAPSDDAYIFYVYAKNFLEGNGLTYNGTIVWGFTSVLWEGLLIFVGLFGLPVHVGGELLSSLSGWFTFYATYLLGRTLGLDRLRSLAPAGLLAATGDFAFYGSVGLEQVLFSGLVALSTAFVVSGRCLEKGGAVTSSLAMAGIVLTRPEGIFVCALLMSIMVWKHRSYSALLCGVLLLLFVTPFLIGLRLYFGDWLPNTFYAKSNAGLANIQHGFHYLSASWTRYGLIFIVGLFVAVAARVRRKPYHHNGPWLLLAVSALWLIYIVLQGGDNMVGGRVLIPILPLLYVAFIDLVPKFPSKVFALLVLSVSAALFTSYLLDHRVTEHRNLWTTSFPVRYEAGKYLRHNFPSKTLVALNPAGIIPYYSGLPTIDMLGLNNRAIAQQGKRDYRLPFGHQAGDGKYVLSRRPGVILFGGSLSKQPGGFISDQEIWSSHEFHENYAPVDWAGIGTAYIRKDLIPRSSKLYSFIENKP